MKKKKSIAIIMLLLVTMGIVACGNKENSTTSAGEKVIKVGVPIAMKPYGFIDVDGELKGFEVDVLKEIDRRMEGVTLELVPSGLTDLVLSLESGKLDLIAYQIEKNEEREKKFTFSEENYLQTGMNLVVRGSETEITSLEDMQGKKLSMNPTEAAMKVIAAFNETHKENPIEVVYRDANVDGAVLVATNKVDAFLSQPANVKNIVEDAGFDLKVVGDAVGGKVSVWHMWRKSDSLTEERTQFDQILREMKADQTLSKMSMTWFGVDDTK